MAIPTTNSKRCHVDNFQKEVKKVGIFVEIYKRSVIFKVGYFFEIVCSMW